MLPQVAALTATLALGTPQAVPLSAVTTRAFRPAGPDLSLHLVDPRRPAPQGGALAIDEAPRPRAAVGGPVCSGDWCQPIVSVPGFEPAYGRAHRSEAFVALLTRAHVEPLATLAWALVSTGIRLDYAPPSFDGTNVNAHGWGSLTFRLRLRLNAHNTPTIPPRPR